MSNAGSRFCFFFVAAIVLSWFSPCAVSQEEGDTSSPAYLSLVVPEIYKRLSNVSGVLDDEVTKRFSFCIKDMDKDWNGAFNFSSDLTFISECIQKTDGDLTKRLCTAAEIKFYFGSFFESGGKSTNYLKPNKNCNLTSWVSGCEPGWGCSVGLDKEVDLRNSKDVPARTSNCQPCCAGFFCPHGLTCMIPCPLGAYCPLSKLNKTTGICDPYKYQIPPGRVNHTCGGADIWADVGSSSEVFCSAGSYCPTTTEKVPCSSGHYCRMGSTAEKSQVKRLTCRRALRLGSGWRRRLLIKWWLSWGATTRSIFGAPL